MRDDREPIGKIRLMKCKVALFMLSLCAKCISNFLNFSVITSVGGMGQAKICIWYFWIAHLFLSPLAQWSTVNFFFFSSIWLEDLRDNWNPAGNISSIFGIHRWEREIGWRGGLEATSQPTGDECWLLRFGGVLLWEPHIDAVSVIFLFPTEINYLTLKYYHGCCSLNKYPVSLDGSLQLQRAAPGSAPSRQGWEQAANPSATHQPSEGLARI